MAKRKKTAKRKGVPNQQNIIGPQVRRLRYEHDWTQGVFIARCARVGLDISRGTLAKVEAQIRRVTDKEFVQLARALQVELDALLPRR